VQQPSLPNARPDVYTVVLTGGIASGKTAVSNLFARLGVPVVDTDRIAHQVVEPGQPALKEIARLFGANFLDDKGRLERRKMRQAIFGDADLKARLEGILHPLIAAEALRLVGQIEAPYCLLVIPLYAESARWQWIDRVLVVDVAESEQIERVMTRDGINRRDAEAILAGQASRQARLALADDVIDNSGKLEDLDVQVNALHQKYLAEAANRPR
jgi:dephospho-CoA kinase